MKKLKLGKFVGEGAFKTCWYAGPSKVALVPKVGNVGHCKKELKTLKMLDGMGFSIPKFEAAKFWWGEEESSGILMQRLYRVWKPRKILEALVIFKELCLINSIYLTDLQIMSNKAGRIFIIDPLEVLNDSSGEHRELDIAIEVLEAYIAETLGLSKSIEKFIDWGYHNFKSFPICVNIFKNMRDMVD
jgi:hypothetical protein